MFSRLPRMMFEWFRLVLVLFWPFLRWLLSIITFFHFLRMVYFWNNPEMNAWVWFLAYFVVLTVFTTIVSGGKKNPNFSG